MTDSSPASTTDWSLQQVLDWLFTEGRMIADSNRFTHELANALVAAGAPLDGLRIMVHTLNPVVLAYADFWSSTNNSTRTATARHGVLTSERYIGSPLQVVLEQNPTLRQPLDELPENPHAAYTELIADGYTDYLGLRFEFSDGSPSAIIFTTKQAGGFGDGDIEKLERLRNYLAPVLELNSMRHTAVSVMNTYVGKRTGKKILNGMIQRGDADLINAALWFSDLRNFTHLTEVLPADQLLEMLNTYFESVSAAVSARGGEILRFIGDAMLIVFPIDDSTSRGEACNAAIDAALDACDTLATLNHSRKRHGQPPIEFGVGLNVGEVIYGNVGAPDRLDFTVMGPAVNRSARLESLTKSLGATILFSEEFARLIDLPVQDLGEHEMKGVDGLQKVYGLQESATEIEK
jgi:adenylate cyclase